MRSFLVGMMKTVELGGLSGSHFRVNGSHDGIQGRLHRRGDIESET